MPALVEAHCHLDKCHTLHRLADVGGDLSAALAAQAQDKSNWTEDDIRSRAARGLAELEAAGCGRVRSHVDWGNETAAPLNWTILNELATDQRERSVLSLAALTAITQMADPGFAGSVARAVAGHGGALGAFVLQHAGRTEGLDNMFTLADRYGLALDFHVDEGLAPGLDGLEAIADTALRHRFEGPVLCGHACALMNLGSADLARVADKLARAGVFVAALPTTNLYLQGRTGGTPDRRGLTRLRELAAAGVPIVVGSDNVADAFCPVGQHDPMAALHLAILAAHLDPPFDPWLDLVTTNAARALGQTPVTVIGAALTDLRISPARDIAELISGRAGPLLPIALPLEADQ